MNLRLRYTDDKGVSTQRFVQVLHWGDVGIAAYCELRGQRRSFRYERITDCVDLDTGEVITNLKEYLCVSIT